MAAPPSPLRVTSNLLVIILILACVAFGIDTALVWYGTPPIIICSVLPLWLDLVDPWFLILAVIGLVLWAFIRSRGALLLCLAALLLTVTPWLLVDYLHPRCV